jgi:polyhydroxyalkanoate synthase
MFPFDLTTGDFERELEAIAARFRQGLEALAGAGDVEVGTSARDLVDTCDKTVLYRYRPLQGRLHPVPLLIVYALVNRPYVADLQPDRSLIRGLLKEGLDVYLIDWGYPDAADRLLTLGDYIDGYLDRYVGRILDLHDIEAVNLLGICQGGVFALCYSALRPERVRNLIATVTPVDFHTRQDMLSHLVRHVDVDLLVDASGNVSGELLTWLFLSLKPFRLGIGKYVELLRGAPDDAAIRNFLRMERWIFDAPDQPGGVFREFVREFYQRNGLVSGAIRIGGRPVDLARLTMPVLNIYARDDHLVPPASSLALERHVGTADYTALEFPGGHIGIYVSSRAQRLLPSNVGRWLEER